MMYPTFHSSPCKKSLLVNLAPARKGKCAWIFGQQFPYDSPCSSSRWLCCVPHDLQLSSRALPSRSDPQSVELAQLLTFFLGQFKCELCRARGWQHRQKPQAERKAWRGWSEVWRGSFLLFIYVVVLHSFVLTVTSPPFLLMASIYPERVKTVTAGIQNIQILTSKIGFCSYTTVLRARFERLFSTPICPC